MMSDPPFSNKNPYFQDMLNTSRGIFQNHRDTIMKADGICHGMDHYNRAALSETGRALALSLLQSRLLNHKEYDDGVCNWTFAQCLEQFSTCHLLLRMLSKEFGISSVDENNLLSYFDHYINTYAVMYTALQRQ